MMMQLKNKPEIHRAEPADDAGRLAGIADFVELQVGHHAGAPPEPRVEEHGGDAGQHERPPAPVARDALRRTMSVTRFGVSLLKVVATIDRPASHQGTERPEAKNSDRALARPLAEEQRRHKTDRQRDRDDHPIQPLQMHEVFSRSAQGKRYLAPVKRSNRSDYSAAALLSTLRM